MPEAMVTITDASNSSDKSKLKSFYLKQWRRASQLVGLAVMGQWSFYGIFRCPFIVPYVSCRNCPVITCHGRLFTLFLGFWALLPLSALLFGRTFCGWACPGGLVNQLVGETALLKLRFRNVLAVTMPYFKYVVLALVLYVWLLWGQPREAVPIRIGDLFSSVKLTFEHANLIWLVRTGIVIGLLLSGLLLANAWCRFICPTGALLEILKRFSLFKVYKSESCNDCDKCRKICGMGTRPAEFNCTNCCDCLPACPRDAIKIGIYRR